jgi:flavin-dependent dehydrogenase
MIDCIIIGGGPAGSAAGAVLAEHGHRVLLLEREKFPRCHIGESLLPFPFHPLQRLGLIGRMKSSAFVKKYSVQFVSPSGRASQPFYFYTRSDRETVAQTWQVFHSDFDQMLLDNAREKGVEVKEQTTATELIKEGDTVFSSGVMLALKSGVLAGDAIHQALVEKDFSPERFADYGRFLREGVENMRKLVYAFYHPKFSFRQLTNKYPEAARWITDCLSGDVNKDFTPLWKQIEEFVPLPEPLPLGQPLANGLRGKSRQLHS